MTNSQSWPSCPSTRSHGVEPALCSLLGERTRANRAERSSSKAQTIERLGTESYDLATTRGTAMTYEELVRYALAAVDELVEAGQSAAVTPVHGADRTRAQNAQPHAT